MSCYMLPFQHTDTHTHFHACTWAQPDLTDCYKKSTHDGLIISQLNNNTKWCYQTESDGYFIACVIVEAFQYCILSVLSRAFPVRGETQLISISETAWNPQTVFPCLFSVKALVDLAGCLCCWLRWDHTVGKARSKPSPLAGLHL